ncbi:uncharacterized protein LOC127099673 [Lathyrus oleraceus]|uniref:uncharacterized protein LOC127099673 n=1 Tax=Pisum sativum TaxID=3888 RepID=UPI0021D177EA|nr:uncharacterized protein LOC127099673 [Pisum sativum]
MVWIEYALFVTMTCERSGKYKYLLRNFKRDNTGSRKCKCPFKVHGYMLANKNWRFNVICGLHNHDLCEKIVGHPSVCQLMPEEKEYVVDMTLNLVQPKNILATLKRKRLENISNIKQVYNIWHLTYKPLMRDRTEMQQLLKLLDDISYMSRYHITKNVRSRVKPVVWTKQIESEDGKMVKVGVVVEKLSDAWNRIINSSTKEPYVDSLIHFRKVCEKYPDLLKYVESTILDQVKENIVCAWTDNVRHLGNTITNRVKFVHATLKFWLGNSKGDLCRDWDSVNHMIQNQHNEIQTSFGRSITVLEHRFKDNILYSRLVGNISRAGLNYIFHEAKRADNVGSDSIKYGCTIVKTYGLSCACVISKKLKLGDPIKMDEVCTHWKRLRFDDDGVMNDVKFGAKLLRSMTVTFSSCRSWNQRTKCLVQILRKILAFGAGMISEGASIVFVAKESWTGIGHEGLTSGRIAM